MNRTAIAVSCESGRLNTPRFGGTKKLLPRSFLLCAVKTSTFALGVAGSSNVE